MQLEFLPVSYVEISAFNITKHCRFGAFEELKKHFAGPNGVLDPHKRMLCGLGECFHHQCGAYSVQQNLLNDLTFSVPVNNWLFQ